MDSNHGYRFGLGMLTKQQKKKGLLQAGIYDLPSRSTQTSAAIERRSWEPWTDKENLIFFDSLSRNSRNWGEIARDVGTKRQEQVRTYYYRVLRRISKMLSSVNFNLDNRDRVATLVAMLAYWNVHNEMPTADETTPEFAQTLKDRIMQHKAPVSPSPVEAAPARTSRVAASPTATPAAAAPRAAAAPEKVVIQLVPRSTEISELVAEAGFNPRLQLTFKSKRSISNIVDHVTKKWVNSAGVSVALASPIRLNVLGQSGVSGCDWGIEESALTILEVYQMLGCPPAIKLEYYWSCGFEDQEVEEVDDDQFEDHAEANQDDQSKSSIFEATAFVHPLAQQYTIFDQPQTSIFEMDPVSQQFGALNLVSDPFDEANSLSVDADAHFEPMTADDDDDLQLMYDDQASTESMLSDDASAAVAIPATPAIQAPRVIFTTQPKKPQPVPTQSLALSNSQAFTQARAPTPSPFPATPVALNMSYNMSSGQSDSISSFLADDPVFGLNVTMGPVPTSRYTALDPLNSPSDEADSFLASSSPVQVRAKAFKQHERPPVFLDGSDADDEEYAYAFNHFTTPKRPRMDLTFV